MDLTKINNRYKKISYYSKPADFTVPEWQYALRKQFGETHAFHIEKTGKRPVYDDYSVYNPVSKLTYKVALRSKDNTANFCECNDFKTNGLGTCKHIEAVFHFIDTRLNKSHLLDSEYKTDYTSVYLDYRDERKVRIRIGTENAAEFSLLAQKYFDDEFALKENVYEHFNDLLTKGQEINASFRCYPDALLYVLDHRENLRRQQNINEKYIKNISNGIFDSILRANLFHYQKEGICFAASKGRCIIADDMGLGKTIQAIGATELLRREAGISTVFIICPTSLKYQWKTEIEKFTGQDAWVVEGNHMKRQIQYANDSFYKIVSYNTAVNDIKEINLSHPDLFILDEAQRIKNFKTRISQNIKRLKSPYTFVLTGTPLENKLEELYSIVQFVNPFALGPFWKYMSEYSIVDEVGKIKGYRSLNKIGEKLSDIMIRRRKKDVLIQLPERMDKVLYVSMTEQQSVVHAECQESVSRLVFKWRRQGFLNEKDRQNLMIFMNMMRMVCDSTYILDQKTRNDTKIGELLNILEEVFAVNDEKVVIFSQWERMTRLVAAELDKRSVKYQYLHGGVPGSDRGKLLERFSSDNDCKVFLSTDAGGVGLNLQAASVLINLDIPWNPAVLEQRISRVFRHGQKHNVSVINMVSAGTIEHKMLGVLSFKKGLADGILDQGDNTVFLEESKFKALMSVVENIVEDSPLPGATSQSDETEEPGAVETPIENTLIQGSSETGKQAEFDGDDDIPQSESPASDDLMIRHEEMSATELVQMGMSFLGRLSKTLSNPEATKELISTIIQKDETNGKTYLKIPIENQEVIENAVALFAGLLGKK